MSKLIQPINTSSDVFGDADQQPEISERTKLIINNHSNIQEVNDPQDNEPKLYKYRWLILIIQSSQGFMASFYQTIYTSITSSVIAYYKMKPTDGWKVVMTSTVYLLLNFPFSCLAAYVLKRKGLRFSLFIGAITAFIAAWIKFAGFKSGDETFFWIGFAGCVFGSMSPPFIVNTSTLISKTWFPPKQRTIATTISSFCNILGTGACFGIAVALAGDANYNNDTGMIELLTLQAGISSVLLLVTVIFFREKPPSPPYLREEKVQETSFIHDTKAILTNFPFILILLAFSFGIGSVNAFLTELNSIATAIGYSVTDVAFIGTSIVITGLLGAVVFGIIADITKRYKTVLLVAGISAAAFYIWYSVNNMYQRTEAHFIMAMVAICFFGFFAIPLVPILLEMASELTFPVPESFSSSLMFGCGTMFSGIFIFICEALKQTDVDSKTGKTVVVSMQNSMWFCMAMFLCSVFCAVIAKPNYKRMTHEKSLHNLASQENINTEADN